MTETARAREFQARPSLWSEEFVALRYHNGETLCSVLWGLTAVFVLNLRCEGDVVIEELAHLNKIT